MRRRESRAAWAARLARLSSSGQSLAAFARSEGIHPGTLGNWRRKLKGTAPQFVEVLGSVVGGGNGGAFDVELRSGHRVRVPADFASEAFARLVAVLEARR